MLKLENGKKAEQRPPPEIDANGNRVWENSAGGFHRDEDLPAWEGADGTREWWKNGERHRENGPAIESAGGRKEWYQNGKRHRENGPAIEYANGRKDWYQKDKLYRPGDLPAVERADS